MLARRRQPDSLDGAGAPRPAGHLGWSGASSPRAALSETTEPCDSHGQAGSARLVSICSRGGQAVGDPQLLRV